MSLRIKLFHLWFRIARPMTLGVRAVAFDTAGNVLLVRHTYVPGWHLPGGGVEPGETAEEALAKELEEEANVRLGGSPELSSIHFNSKASKRDHVLVYVCRNVAQSATRAPDREILEAGFFPPDALPEGTTEATRRRLAELRDGIAADPYW